MAILPNKLSLDNGGLPAAQKAAAKTTSQQAIANDRTQLAYGDDPTPAQKAAALQNHVSGNNSPPQAIANDRKQDHSDHTALSMTSQDHSLTNQDQASGPKSNTTSGQAASFKIIQKNVLSDETRRLFHVELDAGESSTLPLDVYLACAAELWNASGGEELAIEGRGEATALWMFFQVAKGHPGLLLLGIKDAWRKLDGIVSRWKCGKDGDGWERFFGVDLIDAEAEFFDCWHRIRLPGKLSPLKVALLRAKAWPLGLRPGVNDTRPDGYQRFISFAAWLQKAQGEAPIFLPVQAVGKALGVSQDTSARYIRWAVLDGYLTRKAKSQGHSKAAEFSFELGMFDDMSSAPGCVRERPIIDA